ncbi:hypothetical protein NFI96_005713, partial [Prochilodus magdalenae]
MFAVDVQTQGRTLPLETILACSSSSFVTSSSSVDWSQRGGQDSSIHAV